MPTDKSIGDSSEGQKVFIMVAEKLNIIMICPTITNMAMIITMTVDIIKWGFQVQDDLSVHLAKLSWR